jgi:AcrR family transcriptional regulator
LIAHVAVKPPPGAISAGKTSKAARPAQRRRTRKAIVDAAMALLAQGRTPSVADVASAAEVSRRTVYMYFPTLDQLLIDATLGALSQAPVDRAIETSADDDDLETRVDRMVRALHRVSPGAERLGRALIRLTVDSGSDGSGTALPRRGFRRIQWIESVVAPYRDVLGAAGFRRLVAGLAMVVGWEAMIVQRDICGMNPREGEALSGWAARALTRAAVQDATENRPTKTRETTSRRRSRRARARQHTNTGS